MPAQAPTYPSIPVPFNVAISTANTDRTGASGTLGTCYTAPGTSGATARGSGLGAVVEGVRVRATGTTTAGAVRFFRYDGTTHYLVLELMVTAITPSTAIEAWKPTTAQGADVTGFVPLNLKLKPGEILKATTHNAEAFHISGEAGVYE